MLELRPNCELCDKDLPPPATDARICTYECTFCAACVDGVLGRPARRSAGRAVKPNRSIPSATVIPVLIYPDVREAVAWLTAAFGFAERVKIGEDHRSQMSVPGGGAVIIGDVRHDRVPPREGESTHSVVVRVDDANAHLARAR